MQLKIQLLLAFQCSSGKLFSKYVKKKKKQLQCAYLICTNNTSPNHTDAVAIVWSAPRKRSMYAT